MEAGEFWPHQEAAVKNLSLTSSFAEFTLNLEIAGPLGNSAMPTKSSANVCRVERLIQFCF
jgi:hypothetical protein